MLLSAEHISINFGSRQLLEDVNFYLNEGDKTGIIGINGTGKSTFLKVLAGVTEPDGGRISRNPNVQVSYLPQNPVMDDDATLLEQVFLHFPAAFRALNEYEAKTMLNKLGLPDFEQKVGTLSGGQRKRVALAAALIHPADVLVLDEPTNHLDLNATVWLEDYISHYKGTVLVISHDRYFLDKTISRVVELKQGKAEFYAGNYSFYALEKERRYLEQLRRYKKEQAELQRLSDTVRSMHEHNTEHLHKRAFSIEKRMERLQTTGRPEARKRLKVKFAQAEFRADDLLTLKQVGKAFGDQTLFAGVDLRVEPGDRIALLGDNGTGKSTLLKIILGEEPQDTGKVEHGLTVKTGYLPQQIRFAHPERTLYDTMLYEAGCNAQQARDRLGRFLFQGEDVFKPVSVLSGGEQSRLRLCMLMDEKVNFLILDEPTNHLDLDSREWIEEAVEEFEGTLLFVSHDRYFIDRFATRIWTLEGGVITDFRGDYQAYLAHRERLKTLAPPPKREEKPKKEKPKRPGGTKQLKKDLAAAEKRMEKLDQLLADLNQRREAAASDYQALQAMAEEEAAYTEEYDQLMETWEQLSEAIAAEEG